MNHPDPALRKKARSHFEAELDEYWGKILARARSIAKENADKSKQQVRQTARALLCVECGCAAVGNRPCGCRSSRLCADMLRGAAWLADAAQEMLETLKPPSE